MEPGFLLSSTNPPRRLRVLPPSLRGNDVWDQCRASTNFLSKIYVSCLASASVHRSWDPESGQGKKMPSLTGDGQVMAIQHATKSVQIARAEQCSDCGALAACATTYISISYSGRKCKMSRASSYVWRQDLHGSMILRCLYQKCVGAARAFGNFGGLLRGTRHHLIPETVVTVF